MKEEKKALEAELLDKAVSNEEGGFLIEKKDKPHVMKISFDRIKPDEFYDELTNLGFTSEAALEIISWIDLIYLKDKFFFLGKKIRVIKACLACNGAVLLGVSNVTRHTIKLFFKVNSRSIQNFYKAYRRVILEEKPNLAR